MQPIKPFENLLVVELASVLAGPAVGMFFAELGARVVKVENAPVGGDMTRHWKLPSEDPTQAHSAYYCSVNWGKEVWMKDLKQAADRTAVYELISKADIVISNFQAATAAKLGMDTARLQSLNPRLIIAHLSGFPEGDPRLAFDLVLQAETGFLFMSGEPDRPPSKMPVALIDLLAAHQLKEGILIALLERAKSGKGGVVEASLYGSALSALANQATNYLMAGHIPQRMGSLHPNIAPYGELFHTSEGKEMVLAVGTDKQFAGLCRALGLSHLIDHALFSNNESRVKHRSLLAGILEPAIRLVDQETLMTKLALAGVPAGRVRNLEAVFSDSEAQQLILEEVMPDGTKSKRVATVAFKFSS
ncbi:MAG: CoA transferase [Saprospiraceae bacterium]|nr:CoA transferase [Saprospiraceae bacterium]